MSASRRLSTRTGPSSNGSSTRRSSASSTRQRSPPCRRRLRRRRASVAKGAARRNPGRSSRSTVAAAANADAATAAQPRGEHPRPSLTDRRSPVSELATHAPPLRVTRRERANGMAALRASRRADTRRRPDPDRARSSSAPASINPDGRIAPTPMDDAPRPGNALRWSGAARGFSFVSGGRAKRRGDPFCGGGRLPTPDRQKLGRADRKSLHNRVCRTFPFQSVLSRR